MTDSIAVSVRILRARLTSLEKAAEAAKAATLVSKTEKLTVVGDRALLLSQQCCTVLENVESEFSNLALRVTRIEHSRS